MLDNSIYVVTSLTKYRFVAPLSIINIDMISLDTTSSYICAIILMKYRIIFLLCDSDSNL